jgi:hypothetical protein
MLGIFKGSSKSGNGISSFFIVPAKASAKAGCFRRSFEAGGLHPG